MKFSQLGIIFQSCDRLAKFWLDSENQNKFFSDIQKKSWKSKIGTQNSVKFMPKIEEWCSWVKIFILYGILLILARANQNSLQIFHQSQISK